ncbi:MAG: helix-turn-helix transcriptional regulator [Chloroflexi bacterium]|nr:helix-turn-helix transcriptional regulator [Chloroflexota bacterium]
MSSTRDEYCLLDEEATSARLREALVDEDLAFDLASLFGALADPTRIRIVSALHHSELCVTDLVGLLGISQPAVSHQLRILRSLRLVRARRKGRRVFYSLDDEHVRILFEQGLDHLGIEADGSHGGAPVTAKASESLPF